MVSFSRLRTNWLKWTALARMANPSVSSDEASQDAVFRTDDETFHLRREGTWWVLDRTNDRGKLYTAVAKFSSFELAEKYLIWDWATSVRSDLASGPLGTDLYKLGYSPSVKATEIRLGFVEISGDAGTAALSTVNATIFSHLMAKPVEEIERLVNVGMPDDAK